MKHWRVPDEISEIALRFMESQAMADHLRKDGLSINDVIKIITYSRSSLADKLAGLKSVHPKFIDWNKAVSNTPISHENGEWEASVREQHKEDEEELGKLIDMIEFSLNEIHGNTPAGTVFILHGYCFEDKQFTKPFTAIEAAVKSILRDTEKYRNEPDYESYADCSWYVIEKWLPGENGEMKSPVEWIISDEGVFWYAEINEEYSEELKRLTEDAYYDLGWVDHEISGIGTPFKVGDIVTVDHRPSYLLSHALIASIFPDNEYDCCGIRAVYLDEDGKLQESSLKHDIGRCCTTLFSCMLRLEKHIGELPEEESILNTVREKIAGKYESMEYKEYSAFVHGVIDSLNEDTEKEKKEP